MAISAPGYVLRDLTAEEREATRESNARQKDARDRSAWDTDPPREGWRVFRDDVRVSVDGKTFERMVRRRGRPGSAFPQNR